MSIGFQGLNAFSLAAALALMTCAAPSMGQAPADKAAAEALFAQGIKLMEEGKFPEACTRFEESLKLDSAMGTLGQLAMCQEKLGRTASAWALYKQLVDLLGNAPGQAQREALTVARERVAKLEPLLPWLIVQVSGEVAGEGFSVTRGGRAVGKGQWGVAVPVDPGEHVIEVKGMGYQPLQKKVEAKPGETLTVELRVELLPRLILKLSGDVGGEGFSVWLNGAAMGKAQWGVPLPVDVGKHVIELKGEGYQPLRMNVEAKAGEKAKTVELLVLKLKAPPPPPPPFNPWRIAAYATGGAGIAAMGTGFVFGLAAKAKNDASLEHCPSNRCTSEGAELRNTALLYGNVSTGLVVGGAALVGAGVLFLFIKPPAPEKGQAAFMISPYAGPSGAGLWVEGSMQ